MPLRSSKTGETQKPVLGRILLVDDEERLARNLSLLLGKEGYRVDVACSGEGAVDLLKENEYDLLITDLIMPGIDGFQLMEHARTLPEELCVIVVTGYGSMESAIWAMRQGATDYLPKPLDRTRRRWKADLRLPVKRHPLPPPIDHPRSPVLIPLDQLAPAVDDHSPRPRRLHAPPPPDAAARPPRLRQ